MDKPWYVNWTYKPQLDTRPPVPLPQVKLIRPLPQLGDKMAGMNETYAERDDLTQYTLDCLRIVCASVEVGAVLSQEFLHNFYADQNRPNAGSEIRVGTILFHWMRQIEWTEKQAGRGPFYERLSNYEGPYKPKTQGTGYFVITRVLGPESMTALPVKEQP